MGTTLPSCSRSVAGVGSRAPLIGRGPTIANTTTPPSVHISGGNYRHKLLKSLCAAVNFESLSDQLNCPGIRSRLLVTFRRKNRIFGSTQAHSKAEKPHRNARWGGFEVVN